MATLRELLRKKDIPQSVVAEALGILPNNLKRYDDLSKRSIEEIRTISSITGINISELIGVEIGLNYVTDEYQIPNDGTYRLVPVINSDAVGGMHKMNDISATDPEFIKGYIPFTDALEEDLCIPVTSDSMIPTCPPGCVVQIREVENWKEYFGFGNLFVIQLKDGRRIIKEVTKYEANPKDYVLCISHNKSVPAEELPKNFIVSVWKVIKVLTDRGW